MYYVIPNNVNKLFWYRFQNYYFYFSLACASAEWADTYGNNCAAYGSKNLCHWYKDYFLMFTKDGFNGGDCQECGCQGEPATTTTGE